MVPDSSTAVRIIALTSSISEFDQHCIGSFKILTRPGAELLRLSLLGLSCFCGFGVVPDGLVPVGFGDDETKPF